MNRLTSKVAIITGGASGLGLAYAKLFVAEGAKVVLADVNEKVGQREATNLGKNAAFYLLDVTSESNWEDAFQFATAHFGQVNVLVNNAGIANLPAEVENFTVAMWNKVLAINLTGTMLGIKYAIQNMKVTGGSIVNVASAIGQTGFPLASAYSASKAAITKLTKTAALEVTAKNYPININSAHPGWVDTGIIPEELKENILKNIPVKKMGTPEDVAYLVLYLASDEAKYATGSQFVIDGGFLAQ
ncbi:SDR family oxidoreductase [Lapidilactobacillus mulanensis]|uniref:SDR family oxidoreductase n=1 Tax=Lapidilactobacillus mulanensis TaxID=2485999 RepID=A0ABW4DN88_9LACO|nr:SDR family oxidoreductase [Lapidilactobacillus mulanensis]